MNATFVPSGIVPLLAKGPAESLMPPLPAVKGQPVIAPVAPAVLASVSKLGLTTVWPKAGLEKKASAREQEGTEEALDHRSGSNERCRGQ